MEMMENCWKMELGRPGDARTQRAHSPSTDILHKATREEISGKKPLLLVITASQLCVALQSGAL